MNNIVLKNVINMQVIRLHPSWEIIDSKTNSLNATFSCNYFHTRQLLLILASRQ